MNLLEKQELAKRMSIQFENSSPEALLEWAVQQYPDLTLACSFGAHDQNYPSIGCTYCTRPVKTGEDPRAGRWSGKQKTECGLHLDAKEREEAE